MQDDVIALMDHLGIERADLMGYSMGGFISMALMVRKPERFRNVIISGVGARRALTKRDSARGESIAGALEADDKTSVSDAEARGFREFAEISGNDLRALAAMQRGAARREWLDPSQLEEVKLPVMVLVGESDTLVGPAEPLAAKIPGAKLVKVPGDHLTAPATPEFRAAVVEFLAEHSEVSSSGVTVGACAMTMVSETSATAAGLSPERLQRIDKFLRERYIEPGKIPGALTVVYRRGEVAHFSTIGMADVEHAKPVREDTIYRIYSMTKPITSVAFMQLVERGLVALDDPVHKHIPEWEGLGVYQGGTTTTFRTKRPERPMLIVDLLRHTSGLTYGFQQSTNVDAAYRELEIGVLERKGTLEEMIEKLAKVPLDFSPGTAWNYSVSTDVLGYLVGKLSGVGFDEYLRTQIFEPLAMVDTGFHVREGEGSRLAASYAAGGTLLPGMGTPPEGGKMLLLDNPEKSAYLQPATMLSGGGGLVSTAADYLRFCRMLQNGGTLDGAQILSPKTIQLMTMNHLPEGKDLPALSRSLFSEANYNGIGFGLGFSVILDVGQVMVAGSVGNYSWGGAASTYFWIDPKEEMICIFMTQLLPSTTYPIRRELATLVYSAFTS